MIMGRENLLLRQVLQYSVVLVGAALIIRQRYLFADRDQSNVKKKDPSTLLLNASSLNALKEEKGLTTTTTNVERVSLIGSTKVELAVKMHCESCARQVRGALEKRQGVTGVVIDLSNETVVVTGNGVVVSDLVSALKEVDREVRVVGTGADSVVPSHVGLPEEWGSAVVEFKGKIYAHGDIVGVVRIVQTSPEECYVETELSSLKPKTKYSLHVHEYGDTRSIPKTVGGRIQNSLIGEGIADGSGNLKQQKTAVPLHVWEMIGRSIVLYENDQPLYGAVIARSAGVGANTHKRLCTCDGTVIWEAK